MRRGSGGRTIQQAAERQDARLSPSVGSGGDNDRGPQPVVGAAGQRSRPHRTAALAPSPQGPPGVFPPSASPLSSLPELEARRAAVGLTVTRTPPQSPASAAGAPANATGPSDFQAIPAAGGAAPAPASGAGRTQPPPLPPLVRGGDTDLDNAASINAASSWQALVMGDPGPNPAAGSAALSAPGLPAVQNSPRPGTAPLVPTGTQNGGVLLPAVAALSRLAASIAESRRMVAALPAISEANGAATNVAPPPVSPAAASAYFQRFLSTAPSGGGAAPAAASGAGPTQAEMPGLAEHVSPPGAPLPADASMIRTFPLFAAAGDVDPRPPVRMLSGRLRQDTASTPTSPPHFQSLRSTAPNAARAAPVAASGAGPTQPAFLPGPPGGPGL